MNGLVVSNPIFVDEEPYVPESDSVANVDIRSIQ